MSNSEDMLLDILKQGISIEIFGQEYYSKFSELVSDKNAKAIFRGLLWDEKEHQAVLEEEYMKISGKPVEMGMSYEKNRELARRIFPESPGILNITETMDVLKLGIGTEERSIVFFSESAQKNINKKSKDLLLKLVRFEEIHKNRLEGILHYLGEEGSLYGYFTFYTRWSHTGLSF